MSWPYKRYRCQNCGTEKDVLCNHDGLPEMWERCTDQCMWDTSTGEVGPVLYSESGEKTGFHKRKFIRVSDEELQQRRDREREKDLRLRGLI